MSNSFDTLFFPDAKGYTTCPKCGERALKQHLASHQETPFCTGKKFALDQEEDGRKPVFLDRRFLLDDLGIEYVVGHMPGAHDLSTQALWVPPWLWRIITLASGSEAPERTRNNEPRGRSTFNFFAKYQYALIEYINVNPHMHDMIDGIYMLGGADALEDALMQEVWTKHEQPEE